MSGLRLASPRLQRVPTDLAAGDVASYTFITPNLCNDMHGASGCRSSNAVKSGDTWLSRELPRIISYPNAHAGVVFITWDEGSSTLKMPFIAVGLHAQLRRQVRRSHPEFADAIEGLERQRALGPVQIG